MKRNPEFTELGLEAIEINREWYYVKEKVKTEIASLQAELASAGQREVGAWAERDQYLESNVKLVKEIERLREALKPFADAYKNLLENWGREDFVLISLARRHQDIRITIADFGRAHAALAPSPKEKA
jgi:hypothetical protein